MSENVNINDKNLSKFLSEAKINLINEIGNEDDPLKKIIKIDAYIEKIVSIIEAYRKILIFVDSMKKEVVSDNPDVLDKVAFLNMINIGLKVKPDEKNEKMIVDFENSKFFKEEFSKLPPIEKPLYKRIARKFVEDLNIKIDQTKKDYELNREIIKELGWEIF